MTEWLLGFKREHSITKTRKDKMFDVYICQPMVNHFIMTQPIAKMVQHIPVMSKNIIQKLAFVSKQPDKTFSMLDCTVGTAGHTLQLLQKYQNLTM